LPLTAIPIMAPTEVPWLAAGTAQLLAAPTSPESGFTASNISAIAIGRVPLYRRDCAYLI
jgi:hypothetical protein